MGVTRHMWLRVGVFKPASGPAQQLLPHWLSLPIDRSSGTAWGWLLPRLQATHSTTSWIAYRFIDQLFLCTLMICGGYVRARSQRHDDNDTLLFLKFPKKKIFQVLRPIFGKIFSQQANNQIACLSNKTSKLVWITTDITALETSNRFELNSTRLR